MAKQQAIVQPKSMLSRALSHGALALCAVYVFATFIDHLVLPKAQPGDWTSRVAATAKESARGVLADAVEKTSAKIWK